MPYASRREVAQMIAASQTNAYMANQKLIESMFMNFKSKGSLSHEVEDCAISNITELDRLQFLTRYEWEGLPNITSKQLERIIYEKGWIMMFYSDETGKYYYLPCCLSGTIDVYGRYNSVKPVPMGTTYEKLKETNKVLYDFLTEVVRDIVKCEDDLEQADKSKQCVLLYDRTPGLSETVEPRMILAKGMINFQAETLPLLRTTLINDTGTKAVRVNNADEASSVFDSNNAKIRAAKTGQGLVPVTGTLDFQDLNAGGTAQTTEFLQSYQAIDNIRKSFMGLGSGAAFEKNAHMLEGELSMNSQSADDVLEDGFKMRKTFCDLANKLFGLNISVKKKENKENVTPTDKGVDDKGGAKDE